VLDWLATNRALRSTHEFTAILWIPLGLAHVACSSCWTAGVRTPIGPADLLCAVPGLLTGTLAIGLGQRSASTSSCLVAVTGWLRRRDPPGRLAWIQPAGVRRPAPWSSCTPLPSAGSDFQRSGLAGSRAVTWFGRGGAGGAEGLARILWGPPVGRGPGAALS